jgi:hypothetical protein
VEKHGNQNVTLIGGMTRCPGIVQRLNVDLVDTNIKLTVDENFFWNSAAKIVSQKNPVNKT